MLSFAQKGVLLALDEAERRVKAGAAAQDTGLAVARAEVIERDIELPLARTVLRILEQVELVRRARGHEIQRANADAAQRSCRWRKAWARACGWRGISAARWS